MSTLDWSILAAYMVGMILFSVWIARSQKSEEDYYVGGRDLPWWAVAVSTMATQTSAVGFISVPAFVALREGGGLLILQNELAVPLAMIVVMVLLIPLFRRMELISIYEYIDKRFGSATRLILAGVFLISRGLATGVGVYASAIVMSVCLEAPLWSMILLIGVVTIIYDAIGGIAAVVYSDVIQMVILILGVILCIHFALEEVGGWSAALAQHDPARFVAMDLRTGVFDGAPFPMWGFLIGGLFLYASYYGCDQSQAQRELSARTLAATKYSLVFNGIARLPLGVAYLAMGLAVGAVFLSDPEAMASIPDGNADYMVPTFVLRWLPQGLRALIFAAILAAAMSSLDSALNSLSASTMRDFIERFLPEGDAASRLRASKITTVVWGVVLIGTAFLFGGEETVVEKINKIGSAFYGPILAAFLVGVTLRRVNQPGMIAGVVLGVGCNLVLWLGFDDGIFWMWWNVTGCVVAVVGAVLVSFAFPPSESSRLEGTLALDGGTWEREKGWLPVYGALVLWFVAMVAISLALPGWLEGIAGR